MNKITQIKNFIGNGKKTRKEIVKFLKVNINGMDEAYYDANRSRYTAHYSTNFCTWKTLGYVVVDSKHRYSLTKLGKRSNSFYAVPIEMKLEALKSRNRYLEARNKDFRDENYELRNKIFTAKQTLE